MTSTPAADIALPGVKIYWQPANTTAVHERVLCSPSLPKFAPIYLLAQETLGHLANSPTALAITATTLHLGQLYSSVAQRAFTSKYPGHAAPTPALVAEYISSQPPDIIIINTPTSPHKNRDLAFVLAGSQDPDLVDRNEIFVSAELTEALIEDNPIQPLQTSNAPG
ncbi:hypothetical protein C8R46DRAFT_1224498 [Mycena filopes]|nr:hypothetical protein C8R46DRAFT_1224498 [Mycena filopes]